MIKKYLSILLTLLLLVIFACSTIQKDYEKARQTDTIAAYREFLNKYPDSNFTKPAMTRIEEKNFEKAESENTVAAYERFLEVSESDLFKNYAKQRILNIYTEAFEKAKAQNSVQAYEQYVKDYPQSMFAKESVDRIDALMWSLTIKGKSALSYYNYLNNCTYCSQHRETAQKRLNRAVRLGEKINFAYIKDKVQKIIQRKDIVVIQTTSKKISAQSGPVLLADLSNADHVLVRILIGAQTVSSDDLAQGTYQSRPKLRFKNSMPKDRDNTIGFNTIIIYPDKDGPTEVIFIADGNAYSFRYKGSDIY